MRYKSACVLSNVSQISLNHAYLFAALVMANGAGAAFAQSATPVAESDDNTAEIIVTAQKKSESLQKVAAAVSVVNGTQLGKLGVTNLTQIPNLTTGVSITPIRSQAFVFIRGVGQSVTSPNADAAVATNLNGVYLPAEIAGSAFFDVDRVEILPGPQGTLYGRNSTGGVINLTGRLPGDRFAVDGFVEIGNHDRVQAAVGADLPLAKSFAVRIAGTVVRHDGYFNNGEDDQKTSAIKGAAVWNPGETTRITASATYTHDGGIGVVLESQPPAYGCGARCATFDPKALGYFNDTDTLQTSWQVEQELGDKIVLTYIGGYSKLDMKTQNSIFTGPPLAPLTLNEKIDTQSHELRLNGRFGNLDGIFGFYYYDQNSYYYQRAAPRSPAFFINPFTGDAHGWAVFGQGTYSFSDSIRLTGGLRYSNTVKAIDGFNSNYDGTGTLTGLFPFTGRDSKNRIDWKVGVEFDVAPSTMLYGNFSTGFNSGGFSAAQTVAGPTVSPAVFFRPVYLQAWTGGVKNRFLDNKLTLNLEGFYYDYKNYQVAARALTGQLAVFNADKATVYGAQADLKARPTRNDNISLGVTYLHGVADRLRAGGNFDGFDLPYSPKWTFNASYERSFDVGGGAQIRGLVNFKYVSNRWALYTHQAGSDIGDNTNTSVNLGYYADEDRWSLQLWARNLENSLVKTTCGNAFPLPPAGSGTGCFYEPPRTYGARLAFNF